MEARLELQEVPGMAIGVLLEKMVVGEEEGGQQVLQDAVEGRLVVEGGSEAASSDLERLNAAVACVVQVVDEGQEVEASLVTTALATLVEVVEREGGRDSALAREAAKVLLSKCLGRGLSSQRIRVISCLLPLLQDQEDLLTKVLEQVERQHPGRSAWQGSQREAPSLPLWLQLLCSVADLLFPLHPFLQSEQYWSLIQEGLQHLDPLPRKRGLYLLKRSCDSLLTTSPCPASFASSLLHLEAPKELGPLLESYCLLLETLEEKQPHLVRQVLTRLFLSLILQSRAATGEFGFTPFLI